MASILIIDDNRMVRNLLRVLLGREGHMVVESTDGPEAVDRYAEQAIDLVLCDISAARQKGIRTIRQLRQLDPHVKVVGLNGDGLAARLACLSAFQRCGLMAMVNKPFTPTSLLETIDKVLTQEVTPWSSVAPVAVPV